MKKKAKKIYKTCGNILHINERHYVGMICPVCNYFLMNYGIREHVQRLKLPAVHCCSCNHVLKITYDYRLPRLKIYQQTTEAQKMNPGYRLPTPLEYFLRD